MDKKPLILEIKGNSLDDGPGIRTVIFFKGCPLNCVWCHNPESKKAVAEISFDERECVGCNTCIETCTEKALSKNNPFFIDRERCTLCFQCVETCPSGSLSRVGKTMSIDEIVKTVIKDKPFFNISGGGVTLSGGEPTLYMDFVSDLLKKFKAEGIHTLLETCGYFDFERFHSLILPYIDAIYYDIKFYDCDDHKKYCGVPNDLILENFLKLHAIHEVSRPEILPRIPLIPNMTDTEQNLRSIAGFLHTHGVKKAVVLAYNPLWHEKNSKIGISSAYSSEDSMKKWQDKLKIQQCKEIFLHAGIGLGQT
jgi:pyruvate formate lyase activating enzyme